MKEITRKEAIELIKANAKTENRGNPVAVCHKGIWFDVRGMNRDEINSGITKLQKKDRDDKETDERKQESVRKADKKKKSNE